MKWSINVTYVNSFQRILHYQGNRKTNTITQCHAIAVRFRFFECWCEKMKIKIVANSIRFKINWLFALHVLRLMTNPIVLPELRTIVVPHSINSFKVNGLISASGNSIRNIAHFLNNGQLYSLCLIVNVLYFDSRIYSEPMWIACIRHDIKSIRKTLFELSWIQFRWQCSAKFILARGYIFTSDLFQMLFCDREN